MTQQEELIVKWDKIKTATEAWISTLDPKYRIGKTIYNDLLQVLETIVEDLKEFKSPPQLSGEEIKPFDSAGGLDKFKKILNKYWGQVDQQTYYSFHDACVDAFKEFISLHHSNSGEQHGVESQIEKKFAEKGNQLKDVVGALADEKLWEQQPVTGDEFKYPSYLQAGGSKSWDEMSELEQANYNLCKALNALAVSKTTIKRLRASQHPTPGNVVTGELYWKQRCLAAEAYVYETEPFKMNDYVKKIYDKWQQLKNQEVEPGQQNQDELIEEAARSLFKMHNSTIDIDSEVGKRLLNGFRSDVKGIAKSYLLIKKDK